MRASPEAAAVRSALARLWRARLLRAGFDGAAVGCAIGAAGAVAAWITGRALTVEVLASVVAVATAVSMALAMSQRRSLARDVERRAPGCDNLVLTADELLASAAPVRDDIGALVCSHAVERLRRLEPAAVFSLVRAGGRGLAAAAIGLAIVAATHARPLHRLGPSGNRGDTRSIQRVIITVQAPSYTGLPDRTLIDPDRIEAIVGSRLHLIAESAAPAMTLETIDGTQRLDRVSGQFASDLAIARDGFLLLEPIDGVAAGVRRQIGLVADADHPPLVTITKPGRDLFVPTTAPRLAVEINAEDDLGLASLRLAYTKVTGGGENFSFGQGEVSIAVARHDDRHWHAAADWSLAPLALAPGDMVVYRAIAADRRPGGAPVESDAFIVQILSPNQADVGGFSVDEDPNKYALSQRMVVLKTEKLLARKPAMAAADYADEAMNIAAEERQVRAMFIFMLGGEFEDAAIGDALNEVTEAESEGDIAAGRLRNQARVDLATATRLMSRASTSLSLPDVPAALTAEKAALDAIQRAFSKDRYLLRALSTQERLDLSRRLGGTLTDLARAPRPAAAPEPPAVATALRKLLGRLTAAAADPRLDTRSAAFVAIADDCRRADPSSAPLQNVAAALDEAARESSTAGGPHAALDRATAALAAIVRASSPDSPVAGPPDLHRLNGALADGARRGGSR